MFRIILFVTGILILTSCDGTPEPDGAASQITKSQAAEGTYIEFKGNSYEMAVLDDCGPRPDGTYLTWVVTLDANGKPDPDAAHFYAMREAHWSVIDFYVPEVDRIVRMYREDSERPAFTNGVLEFSGELGAGLTEQISGRIVCPN